MRRSISLKFCAQEMFDTETVVFIFQFAIVFLYYLVIRLGEQDVIFKEDSLDGRLQLVRKKEVTKPLLTTQLVIVQ